jgi:hypothetical protein
MQEIPESLIVDARAEITWGRPPQEVLALLQSKGIGDKDAFALLDQLMKERAASIRADGMKKSVIGALFVLAPVCYYFFSLWLGYWSIKLFAALIVLGFVGLAKLTSGLSMVLRPGGVTSDLANSE